jgi:DNA polymerase III delta prime subunit
MKVALLSRAPEINLTNSVMAHQNRMEKDLMSGLDEFVVWQEEAKQAIIKTLIDWLYNVNREQWILWAVFLAWPTWVGKTELARSLARTLLGDPNAITIITAETMPHPADIARLIWAPAGYIWYWDTPEMADSRIHHGYAMAKEKWKLHKLIQWYEAENLSIVLVDEAEKAHPDIMNAFLWAIQSGQMQMATGKESDSRLKYSKNTSLHNTLFIFTSNTWEHVIANSKSRSIGFTKDENTNSGDKEIFIKEFKRLFAPEFIRRMDQVVRCHSLSDSELRKVFELHTRQMNRNLAEKKYFSSLQVVTTRAYVDMVLENSQSKEYWAWAITPAIKHMWSLTGMAIQSWKIPKDANGVLEFDMMNGSPTLVFRDVSAWQKNELTSNSIAKTSVPEHTRNLVEGKINRFWDQVRETVQSYLSLISGYDSGFADTCRILEKRLRGFGFNTKDIQDLQAVAFIAIYQSVDQPSRYEVIIRDDKMFGTVGFRAIEKFLRTAIAQSFSLEIIYQTIRVLLKRPMTRDESVVISQHIHQLLQWKSLSPR